MPQATNEQAIETLRRSHSAIAAEAPEAPPWEAVSTAHHRPAKRRRTSVLLAAGTAIVAGVLVGAFVLGPLFRTGVGVEGSDSQSDLPGWLEDAQVVAEASSLTLIGDDEDTYGPLKVYEAAITSVLHQDVRYANEAIADQTIIVIVPGDLEEGLVDYTTDRPVTLLLAHREPAPGDTPPSEWRIWGMFDEELHELIGPASSYSDDLRAVVPDATSSDLAAWAAEVARVASGGSPGEYTDAWNAYLDQRLAQRGDTWDTTDPRIRSLDPERMPEDRRAEVTGIAAIIDLPDSIEDDPAYDDVSLSIRSDYGVVHQAQVQVGPHYAMLWSRAADSWTVVLLGTDGLDGIPLGTIEPGGARNGEALSIAVTEAALHAAFEALTGGGATASTGIESFTVDTLTTVELNQRLLDMATP